MPDCSDCVVQNKWAVKVCAIVMIFIFATLVVLVWFADNIGTQAGAFGISMLGLALSIATVSFPIKCQPCECGTSAAALDARQP